MDFEIAVVGIGLAREQRLHFVSRHFGLEPLERLLGVGDRFDVVLRLPELDHGELVIKLPLDTVNGGKLILQRSALLHHTLGTLLIGPQIGIFGQAVELGEPPTRPVEVKDASSAARPTA